ncbi:hypothetical protein, partial [Plasmodium yoelii yoelii]
DYKFKMNGNTTLRSCKYITIVTLFCKVFKTIFSLNTKFIKKMRYKKMRYKKMNIKK